MLPLIPEVVHRAWSHVTHHNRAIHEAAVGVPIESSYELGVLGSERQLVGKESGLQRQFTAAGECLRPRHVFVAPEQELVFGLEKSAVDRVSVGDGRLDADSIRAVLVVARDPPQTSVAPSSRPMSM